MKQVMSSVLISHGPSTDIPLPCLRFFLAGLGLISTASIKTPSPPSLQHRTLAQGALDVGPNELTISFQPYGVSQMVVHFFTA